MKSMPAIFFYGRTKRPVVDSSADTSSDAEKAAAPETIYEDPKKVNVHPDMKSIPALILYGGKKKRVVDREDKPVLETTSGDARRVSVNPEMKSIPALIVYGATKELNGVSDDQEKRIPSARHSSSRKDDRIDRPTAHAFFLEKDLHEGAKMNFWASRVFSNDYFLPRRVAESIPFSSSSFAEILRLLSVEPDSLLAGRIKEALRMCEMPAAAVEKKLCATHLEELVGFVTSALGTRDVRILSTAVGKPVLGQIYTISSAAAVPMPGTASVACHAAAYAYTVFHCHMIPASKPYVLRLVGEDGTNVEAAVMCHTDTSGWDPTNKMLVALNEKPGGATVCHLLHEGDLLWVPGRTRTDVGVAAA